MTLTSTKPYTAFRRFVQYLGNVTDELAQELHQINAPCRIIMTLTCGILMSFRFGDFDPAIFYMWTDFGDFFLLSTPHHV